MVKMILKNNERGILAEYVFDDDILSVDTASQLTAYGNSVHGDDAVEFLCGAGIRPYEGEKVERTYTIMT